jgi:hypothetical protein
MKPRYGDWRDGSSFAAFLYVLAREPWFWFAVFFGILAFCSK